MANDELFEKLNDNLEQLTEAVANLKQGTKETEESSKDVTKEQKEYTSALHDLTKAQRLFTDSLKAFKSPMANSLANILVEITTRANVVKTLNDNINATRENISKTKDALGATQKMLEQKKLELDQAAKNAKITDQVSTLTGIHSSQLDAKVKEYQEELKRRKAAGETDEELKQVTLKLSIAKKLAARASQEHADATGDATAAERFYAEKQKEFAELEKKNAEESAELDEQLNKEKGLLKARFAELVGKLPDLAKKILELNDVIRQTQQQFGVAAGQAAKLQGGAFIDSVQSIFQGTFVNSQQILTAQQDFQEQFGELLTGDAASELAQQAKDIGVTTKQFADARRVFMTTTMGDVTQAAAQQDKLIEEFRAKGMSSKTAFQEMSKNSEIFARNGTRFSEALFRAAADAKKIGVELSKVDQVGDNIIGNFEGFLEKQAELGAMGFGFDSQRLAEISETGDTGALLNELRSQLAATGKDLNNLRRSEQLAISSAFGIQMSELQRMAGPTAGSGENTQEIETTDTWLSKAVNWLEKGAVATLGLASLLTSANILLGFIVKNTGGLGGMASGAMNLARGGFGLAARGAAAAGQGLMGAATAGVGSSIAASIGVGAAGLAGSMYLTDKLFNTSVADGGNGNLADAWNYWRSSDERKAREEQEQAAMMAKVKAARAARATIPETTAPITSPDTKQTIQNMEGIMARLDQMVQAIASIELRLDGQKVGQAIMASEKKVAQSAPFRAQRTV